jgi:hypothetical protein
MKRREFIGMAAAGAASVVWTATVGATDLNPLDVLATPHVLGVLRDRQLVHELGQQYRSITPHEDSERALTEAIMGDLDAEAGIPLDARIVQRVAADFSAGLTVTLNGWVLSITEARQCALFSLRSL